MKWELAVNQRIWHAVEALALSEAREAIEYGLIEAGALGTETTESNDNVRVTAYYRDAISVDKVRTILLDALRIYNLSESSLIDLNFQEIPDRDWLSEWKKNWQPITVGRFIVAPPWLMSVPPALARGSGEPSIIVGIDPGMAFGTGTHESTRLCLKAIAKYFRGGSFLDVGTGTGILAIAAAKMYPVARVEACDLDAQAIEIAKENARLNGVGHRINFRVGTVDAETQSADFVCANLTAPVISELLPLLLGAACGRLVLSGILDSQIDLVTSRLLELGAGASEVNQDGEWVALVV